MKSKLTEKQEILTQVALPPENEQIVLCDTARNIRLLQNAIENLAHDLEEYKPRPPYIMKKAKCVYILAKIIATKEDLVFRYFRQTVPIVNRVADYLWRSGDTTRYQLQRCNITKGVGGAKKLDAVLAMLEAEDLLEVIPANNGLEAGIVYRLRKAPPQIAEGAQLDAETVKRYRQQAGALMNV